MASNIPKKNRTDQMLADQRLIDGLTKYAALITPLLIDGVPTSSKDLVGVLQSRITASQLATTARAAWQATVIAAAAEQAKTRAFVSALRQVLLAAFGVRIDTLADFGLTPRKVRVLTPDQTIAAVARAKATRLARHTMGKVQKSKITGANPAGASAGAPGRAATGASRPPASKP